MIHTNEQNVKIIKIKESDLIYAIGITFYNDQTTS